jgi:hypothetical protein
MKRLFFILSIVSVVGLAQNWMVDTDTALSNSQTAGIRSYGQQNRCLAANPGKTCVDFTGHNLRFERFVGGSWIVDVPSKTAYDSAVATDTAKKAAKVVRRNKLKTAPADAAAANSVPALRVIVQDLATELNEIIGN